MVGGTSILFTCSAVVDETHIRKSEIVWKSLFGIDASQIQIYSMCQPMPTGLYTRYEFDAELQKFEPRQNKPRSFEKMCCRIFNNEQDRTAELRGFT